LQLSITLLKGFKMSRSPREAKAIRLRRQQKLRLEAALSNMSEGLCMFDADQRLVMCNERYASIYDLPPELTKPGVEHSRIVDYRLARGMRSFDGESFIARHHALMSAKKASAEMVELASGRIIAIRHQPMADGGWVATHSDITEDVATAREIETQNRLFSSALDTMRQGLCMFDRDRRLVVSNRAYARMYRIAPEEVRPGMTLEEILRQRAENGNIPVEGMNVFIDKRVKLAGPNSAAVFEVEMTDGRVILVQHQPNGDGGWVATHEDITEQKSNQARIRHLASHDGLTDLPNRTLYQDHLEQVSARVEGGEVVAALCVDLDYFKSVNDTLGHAIGDKVLREASRRLVDSVRESDIVARLAGDEFAVLAGRLDRPEDAAQLADRITKRIAEPLEIDGHRIVVGASAGIAVAPHDATDGIALMKHADLALYRAKEDGRGAYHFYEQGLDAALQERRSIEAGLRDALVRDEFFLVFQPLIDLTENRVCSCEALLRWRHPERGLVSPGAFISAAEESGLIVPIGEWVLREACKAAAKWPENICVAVNLSPIQFKKNRSLVDQVQFALDSAGLDPTRLELEITETTLLADNDIAVETLRRLKELGVRLALDDFGTGYSSLSYLRRFPFDKIKIDQSFVRDSPYGSDGLAIVKAVIGLGRSLGMRTTAEGVETEAQLDVVRAEGCTEVQGYLFSMPLPTKEINEFINRLHPVSLSADAVSLAG
jgi:diguanylate cyclase (GGDEF)-like protein